MTQPPKILIGAPVYQRAWILGEWFERIEAQTIPLSDLGFVFELGPDDHETHEVIWEWQSRHPEVSIFDARVSEVPNQRTHPDGKRRWKRDDYHRMVQLRNSLLARVINYRPDRYFSLDSDILLDHPQTLEYLYELTKTRQAVSPLCYMWATGKAFPNVMSWVDPSGSKARRIIGEYPRLSVFKADVIMAAKMMRPEVYTTVRYSWHPQGEDLGWSADALNKGFELYSAHDIYCPHIMHKWMLDQYKDKKDNRNFNGTIRLVN